MHVSVVINLGLICCLFSVFEGEKLTYTPGEQRDSYLNVHIYEVKYICKEKTRTIVIFVSYNIAPCLLGPKYI